jgi:CHAD domain-containing protein
LKKLAKQECGSGHFVRDLRSLIKHCWEKWLASIDDFIGDNTSTGLHQVRIKSKSLRYALKLELKLYPDPELERGADWLKQVQNRVGAWHDELTLGQRAAETFEDLPRDPNAVKLIRRIKEKEIRLAESARDFVESMRKSRHYAGLRRRLSASTFAMANDRDSSKAASGRLLGPVE